MPVPLTLLDRFTGLDVLVVGDAILDAYLDGPAPRLAREAPVPVVSVAERAEAPGGAGNTAVNVAALGGRARLLTALGDDAEGDRLLAALGAAGIDGAGAVRAPARRTLHKQRILADGVMLARVDEGSLAPLAGRAETALAERLADALPHADAVIVSDYGGGVLTPRIKRVLAEHQRRTPGLLIADAKDLRGYRRMGVTAVTPNYDEALALLGVRTRHTGAERVAFLAGVGERLLERAGADLAAATVDAEGCVLVERGRPARHRRHAAAEVRSTTGAGDTFVAALALALAAGARPGPAAELACAAAAVAVGKPGTAACAGWELREALAAPVAAVAAA